MTIKDISALTGYSVGTVSRVLNNQPNVSQKARNAILSAAQAVGFELNENAKQLKQQRSTSIWVVAKGTSNALFGSLIEALQARTSDWPYPLVVDYIDENADEVQRGIRLCREKKPLGIVFLGGNQENFQRDFHQIDVPCVLITGDASSMSFEKLSSVTTDDKQVGFLAVQHLSSLGHRAIAVIGGDRQLSGISRLRYEGALQALGENNIPFDPEQDYATGRFSFSGGYQAVQHLLRSAKPFTAIFAMADVMAIGAIRALQDNHLRVPEDVSVIGVDGLDLGAYTVPKLATVRQSVEELANHSIEMLHAQIEGSQGAQHKTILPIVEKNESAGQL